MARPFNIEIPARFIFRPAPTRWVVLRAEIIDWVGVQVEASGEPTNSFARFLRALDEKLFGKPGEMVQICVDVAAGSSELGDGLGQICADGKVQIRASRSAIPVETLGKHESPITTPDISGRSFDVLGCIPGKLDKITPERDALELLTEFVKMRRTNAEMCALMSRWGLWAPQDSLIRSMHVIRGTTDEGEAPRALPELHIVFPELLWRERERVRAVLQGSAQAWLRTALPRLALRPNPDPPPYFLIEESYCSPAIEKAVTIEHILRSRWGICKRKDCRGLFRRETRQPREYCTTYCAHLTNVRKRRAEGRKANSKRKRN